MKAVPDPGTGSWGGRREGRAPDPALALLERERELELISRLLADAREGRGGLLVTEGAAGLGKSELLRWARKRASAEGMLALSGRGNETEREISFGIVLQLFERWLAASAGEIREELLSGSAGLAAGLFGPRHWESPDQRESPAGPALVHGLFWLVVNASARAPLLLVVDDLHWVDGASLRFLLYLVQRLDELPVAIIVARRQDSPDGHNLADELAAHPLADVLRLAPLSATAISQLLERGLCAPTETRFAQACLEATGGNPFLARSIVDSLRDDRIEPIDANAELIATLRPDTVRQQLLVRISRLGAAATAMASAVAVLGDSVALTQVATLARLEPDPAARAADGLAAAGIFASAHPPSFAHPLLRTVLYEQLPAAQRGRTHARAATLLHAEGAPSERIAPQLLVATRVGDPWALKALRDAAAQALATGSAEPAIHYLTRALREPLDDRRRAEVLLQLAGAEAMLGAPVAEDHVRQALALIDDPAMLVRAQQALGSVLRTRGDIRGAARAFEQALALLVPDDPLARDLHAGYFSAASLHPELAATALAHIEPLLERPPGGERPAERAALAVLAVYRTTSGAPRQQAIALARRAWGDGALLADEGPDGWAWSLVTGAFSWTDEFEQSLAICSAVLEQARLCGSVMGYATASCCSLGPSYYAGRLSEARAHGEAALDARRYGWRAFAGAAAAVQARVLVEQDELEAAERILEGIDELPEGVDREAAIGARAYVRLVSGHSEEALADLLHTGEQLTKVGWLNQSIAPWQTEAALAAHRSGDEALARELVGAALEVARGTGTPSHLASALRAQAVIEESSGAVEVLREALAAVTGSQAEMERVRCLAELGGALRRSGLRAEARRILTDAREQAHRIGARRIERQVHDELKIAGARPRRLRFSGPDSLTASERRVAKMAAGGMGNREIAQALFVTPRTVEQHLYNAYRKLGIGSRHELGEALMTTDPDATL